MWETCPQKTGGGLLERNKADSVDEGPLVVFQIVSVWMYKLGRTYLQLGKGDDALAAWKLQGCMASDAPCAAACSRPRTRVRNTARRRERRCAAIEVVFWPFLCFLSRFIQGVTAMSMLMVRLAFNTVAGSYPARAVWSGKVTLNAKYEVQLQKLVHIGIRCFGSRLLWLDGNFSVEGTAGGPWQHGKEPGTSVRAVHQQEAWSVGLYCTCAVRARFFVHLLVQTLRAGIIQLRRPRGSWGLRSKDQNTQWKEVLAYPG